jgi:hypothetical protein
MVRRWTLARLRSRRRSEVTIVLAKDLLSPARFPDEPTLHLAGRAPTCMPPNGPGHRAREDQLLFVGVALRWLVGTRRKEQTTPDFLAAVLRSAANAQ